MLGAAELRWWEKSLFVGLICMAQRTFDITSVYPGWRFLIRIMPCCRPLLYIPHWLSSVCVGQCRKMRCKPSPSNYGETLNGKLHFSATHCQAIYKPLTIMPSRLFSLCKTWGRKSISWDYRKHHGEIKNKKNLALLNCSNELRCTQYPIQSETDLPDNSPVTLHYVLRRRSNLTTA